MTDSTAQDPESGGLPSMAEWRKVVASCEHPSRLRASWQILNTLGPYIALWVAMYWTLSVSWWLTIGLAAIAGTLIARIFIIFHDCGHGSFFASRRANAILGFVTGVLTFTPYYHWRWQHALHHGTTGNLDRRGAGDIWTLTVREYLESSPLRRLAYRLSRNPIVLFLVAPLFIFLVRQRFPAPGSKGRDRHSVWWMNLAILGLATGLGLLFGFWRYVFIQLIVMGTGGSIGLWLFYVQHQFEGAYWESKEDWDYTSAALQGSSFYDLPPILRWLSGNIGYHHVHHLSSRIPNYNLKWCHESHPMFMGVRPMTLFGSLRTIKAKLWDESLHRLVSFRHTRRSNPNQPHS